MTFDPTEPLFKKEVEQEVEYQRQSIQTNYEFAVRIQTVIQKGHRFIGEDGRDYTQNVVDAVNTVLTLQKVSASYLAQILPLIPVR